MNIDIKNVDTNKELLYNTANLKMNKAQQKSSIDNMSSFLNFNNNDQSLLSNNKSFIEDDSREKRDDYINQFGEQNGIKYYGAIKELEEFLDPNVYQDDDFQIRKETK